MISLCQIIQLLSQSLSPGHIYTSFAFLAHLAQKTVFMCEKKERQKQKGHCFSQEANVYQDF